MGRALTPMRRTTQAATVEQKEISRKPRTQTSGRPGPAPGPSRSSGTRLGHVRSPLDDLIDEP